jgi:hypothetical protein
MAEQLDAGWYEWVISNLGRDQARAIVATRAASEAAAQGLGFNAAANAARASWEAHRLAHVAAVRQLTEADPTRVPGSLIAGTALAVGGALASIVFLLLLNPPWVPCPGSDPTTGSINLCLPFREIAYMFLAGNVIIAALHASLFLLMWRRRAAVAWLASVVLIVAILLFDIVGELLSVVVQANPHYYPGLLETVGVITGLVPSYMTLWADFLQPGGALVTVAEHWLLLHMVLVELPILFLFCTRPARRWSRVHLIGKGS